MSQPNSPKAIVLLSGGLDSATTCAIARDRGFALFALTFRYGQRHDLEIAASKRVAAAMGVIEHKIIDIDLKQFGGSALTGDGEVPKHQNLEQIGKHIPVTYVPARNTIFLAYALAWAEVLGSTDIFLGVNAVDYSGYPDCREDYIRACEKMANLATRSAVEGQRIILHTPLIQMTKADIIRHGLKRGVDYGMTHTCYDPTPSGLACGQCEACLLRQHGFAQAGELDPIRTAPKKTPHDCVVGGSD